MIIHNSNLQYSVSILRSRLTLALSLTRIIPILINRGKHYPGERSCDLAFALLYNAVRQPGFGAADAGIERDKEFSVAKFNLPDFEEASILSALALVRARTELPDS